VQTEHFELQVDGRNDRNFAACRTVHSSVLEGKFIAVGSLMGLLGIS